MTQRIGQGGDHKLRFYEGDPFLALLLRHQPTNVPGIIRPRTPSLPRFADSRASRPHGANRWSLSPC